MRFSMQAQGFPQQMPQQQQLQQQQLQGAQPPIEKDKIYQLVLELTTIEARENALLVLR
jgi:hypothetical protein